MRRSRALTTRPCQKLEKIIGRTEEVWSSLEALVHSGMRVTILLGNHDIEMSLPGPRRVLLDRLGPGRVEFVYDNQAFRDGPVLIEHGNRYDPWNVVSHDALRRVRSVASRGEEAVDYAGPPGSQLVARVINAIKQTYSFVDLLKPEDAGVLPLLAVLHPASLDDIRATYRARKQMQEIEFDETGRPVDPANIAAGEDRLDEADREMVELAMELATGVDSSNIASFANAKDYVELWRIAREGDKQRQLQRLYRAMRARAQHTWSALDVKTEVETYLRPARAAVTRGITAVVMGHTHLAKRVCLGNAVYPNAGTWADLMRVPEGVLSGEEAIAMPQLRKFSDDLRTNDLTAWRRQVPTFVRIDMVSDRVSRADVYFFDEGKDPEPVPDGPLSRLVC